MDLLFNLEHPKVIKFKKKNIRVAVNIIEYHIVSKLIVIRIIHVDKAFISSKKYIYNSI